MLEEKLLLAWSLIDASPGLGLDFGKMSYLLSSDVVTFFLSSDAFIVESCDVHLRQFCSKGGSVLKVVYVHKSDWVTPEKRTDVSFLPGTAWCYIIIILC